MKKIEICINENVGALEAVLGSNIPVDISARDGNCIITVSDEQYDELNNIIINSSYVSDAHIDNKFSVSASNKKECTLVRKLVFAYNDSGNFREYSKALRTFLRRSGIRFEFDKNNSNVVYVFAEVKDSQDYGMLKKQLTGFEYVYDLKSFGIIDVCDFDSLGNEKENEDYQKEVEEIVRSYIVRSLVYKVFISRLYSSRQYILLDKYKLTNEEKGNYYSYYNTDNRHFEKSIDLEMIADSDNICLLYTDSYTASTGKMGLNCPRDIDTHDNGTVVSVVRFKNNDEVIVDTYINGTRTSITEIEESFVTRKNANVFSDVPDENCTYNLGFREYYVRIKNTNYVLHYSDKNDNFEIYALKDEKNTMLTPVNGKGVVCINDSRDIDHNRFLDNIPRISSKYPHYADAVELFDSRKKVKKMTK